MYEKRLITDCDVKTSFMPGLEGFFVEVPLLRTLLGIRGAVASPSTNDRRLCDVGLRRLKARVRRLPACSPQSFSSLLPGRVSLRNRAATTTEMRKNIVAMRFGSTKGYRLKNSQLPKMDGYCLAGSAKKPPKLGPITEPSDHTSGMTENARG